MSAKTPSDSSEKGQFLVYLAEDGVIKIDVRLEGETVWLTQQQMADLFQSQEIRRRFPRLQLDAQP